MHQHQGGSIVVQCPLDDIAGVDGCSGQGAKEQLLVGQDPVLVIEEQCCKNFAVSCLQQPLQGLMGQVFIGNSFSLGQFLPGNGLGDGEQVIVGDKVSHPVGAGGLPGDQFVMQHDCAPYAIAPPSGVRQGRRSSWLMSY
ncbi:hypothetical protein D3C72_1400670 [compost metagenome]